MGSSTDVRRAAAATGLSYALLLAAVFVLLFVLPYIVVRAL